MMERKIRAGILRSEQLVLRKPIQRIKLTLR